MGVLDIGAGTRNKRIYGKLWPRCPSRVMAVERHRSLILCGLNS